MKYEINKIGIYHTNTEMSSHHFSSESLIQSCPLPISMISHKGREQSSLTISAAKIEPLSALLKRNKTHLEYQDTERLIDCIGRQLQLLERENKGISSFNIDDITVFHDGGDDGDATMYFAITNDDKIHDINEDNELDINAPYPKEYTDTATASTKNKAFHSPEFKEFISKKTLPYNLHFKSGYYSFGLLCMYCYVSRTPPAAAAANDYEATLAPIINTKIYWFLKQVLQENPIERRYICV